MTVDRARQLMGFEGWTDAQVEEYIAQSKQACRELLKVIVSEHSKNRIDKKEKLMAL